MPIDVRKFCAKCGVYERGLPLFEINLFAGGYDEAKRVADRFAETAPDLYAELMEKLTRDE